MSSRFRKLSHTIWHCQYHIVWVPKYRYRILHEPVKESAESGIRAICGYASCEAVELNVQPDHVHLVVLIPPKLAISDLLGRLKGQTSMKLFQQFRHLKKKPYWGNHFWAKGYCVDSVGLDADMTRKYVRFQEKKEQQMEQFTTGRLNSNQRHNSKPAPLGVGPALLWRANLKAAPCGCGFFSC